MNPVCNKVRWLRRIGLVALPAALLCPSVVIAGAYIGSFLIPDGVTYPKGYTGSGPVVVVNVCIEPTSPNASQMEQSIKNSVATWNELRSTSANLRQTLLPAGLVDFESVALHELGHCIGLGHPNLGFGVNAGDENFTQSTRGANFLPDLNAGADTIAGTADDVRGDDRNTHYFFIDNNNPFSEPAVVDATTYSNDISLLPAGDLFAANASREASSLPRYNTPFTEAVMQQGAFASELQRSLSHDDVSTLRFAMSGLDRIQGSGDDYQLLMQYGGLSEAGECDISVAMDATRTGFASCTVVPRLTGQDIFIEQANVYFNPEVNWFYNNSPPCSESTTLPANVWVMLSIPCKLGISTSAGIDDVLGDDLDAERYDIDWVLFAYEYVADSNGNYTGAYRKLEYTDDLINGVGYWFINTTGTVTIDVQGEYNAQTDLPIYVEANNANQSGWNLVGQPHRYPTAWADTSIVLADGRALTLAEADPTIEAGTAAIVGSTACTTASGPSPDCTVASIAYSFDSNEGVYRELNLQSGSVGSFSAIWVYAGEPNTKLRFMLPALDRITP